MFTLLAIYVCFGYAPIKYGRRETNRGILN